MKEYDLIVIGAGSGGLVAALTGHRRGLKTAMLERNKVGGECTHTGCVPSKALIQSTKQYSSALELQKYGLPKANLAKPDFARIMDHVDSVIQGIYEHEKPEVFNDAGIDTFVDAGGARFLDSHSLQFGGDIFKAKHFVIATGSSPRIPELPGTGGPGFLDNESFWKLRQQPESIVFLGGGVISAELGQALAKLGTKVYILDRNPRILKVVDEEVAGFIFPIFKESGIKMIGHATVKGFERIENKIITHYEDPSGKHELPIEAVFLAAGRIPNVQGMDLEKAGIEYSPRGIATNEFLQTSQPHIYAVGDVATPAKFTHVAAYQAEVALDNISFDSKRKNDLSTLPWAIFTDPEMAHVGMSEAEAREAYGEEISVFRADASIDRYLTDLHSGGFLKVYFDKNDKVLGADAVGHQAGEWIQQITLIMKNDIPVESLAQTIYAYPTYTEIVKKVFSRYLRTKGY